MILGLTIFFLVLILGNLLNNCRRIGEELAREAKKENWTEDQRRKIINAMYGGI